MCSAAESPRSTRSSLSVRRPLQPSSSRNSMAEDLLTLRNANGFPVELCFTDPESYRQLQVEFSRPRCVHAVSFVTTGDDRQFDPLCWEIDGSMNGEQWMRLQTQSDEFDTPAMRRRPVDTSFLTEPWCKPGSSHHRLDLQKIPVAVSERLCFFASSLRAILKQGTLRHGKDTLLDRKVGAVPTLTQVVPVYQEQVILSEDFLCGEELPCTNGQNTNLGFVISQAEEQWEIFARKQHMAPLELYNAFTRGDLREWLRQAELEDVSKAQEIRKLILDIRLWASQRSQQLRLQS